MEHYFILLVTWRRKKHLPEEYKKESIVETVYPVIKRESGSFMEYRVQELI